MQKMHLVWANINDVIPNPLNPRKDYSTKTNEMQRIIKGKGWETGISCYKSESKFVILSGHRRWFAAQQLGINKIPVLVVQPPNSREEELDRLGSVQGGKVDWSVYEWAKYTYEMWNLWGKCSYKELAVKMDTSVSRISARIKVFCYYPHSEIEEKLENGIFSLSVLYYLIQWLEKLKKRNPFLVDQYKEEMIRKTMLRKIEMKLVNVVDLKNDRFIELAHNQQLTNFLLDSKKSLSDAIREISAEEGKFRNISRVKTHLKRINNKIINISSMGVENLKDAKSLLISLNNLKNEIECKKEELKNILG